MHRLKEFALKDFAFYDLFCDRLCSYYQSLSPFTHECAIAFELRERCSKVNITFYRQYKSSKSANSIIYFALSEVCLYAAVANILPRPEIGQTKMIISMISLY